VPRVDILCSFVVNRGRQHILLVIISFQRRSSQLDRSRLSTAGYKTQTQLNKNHDRTTGTPVVNVMYVARQTHRINSRADKTMKANTTKNLASIVTLLILSPFLALAILVSIQTAGIRNNDMLLLMLTLLSAVLSGINGFGRRTATAVQLSPVKTRVRGDQPSTASVTFAGSSK